MYEAPDAIWTPAEDHGVESGARIGTGVRVSPASVTSVVSGNGSWLGSRIAHQSP